MQNRTAYLVLSLIVTVFTLITIAGFLYVARIANSSGAQAAAAAGTMPVSETQAPPEKPSPAIYILREYDGQIAVFVPQNEDIPVSLTGILTSTLRQSDRDELQRGIYVSGDNDLARLLEDFSS